MPDPAVAGSRIISSNVEGRASLQMDQPAGPIVIRPGNEVPVGRMIENGPIPMAIKADDIEVNMVSGRS
ncbi:MAG: hypothetical protein ABI728_05420 [Betaproteobacteria bacterium]